MVPAPPSPSAYRTLLVLVAVLLGIIVALLTGILTVAQGANLAVALVNGAVAFGGTVTLVVFIERALGLL